MKSPLIFPYARQSIDSMDIQEVSQALASDVITRGSHVEAFEKAVADYCGAKYGVAFNNGSSALQAACHVAELGPYDSVITTPNTFVSTVTASLRLQATPIFVDIHVETGNLNLEQVELTMREKKSSRGRLGIMPVHFAGIPVDMRSIDDMIRDPDVVVIEDAAHALGSEYPNGQRVGCCEWSHMTIFSFHPAKTITTGEGGMVMTNDRDLYHRLRRFRNNGIEKNVAFLQEGGEGWYEGYYEVCEMTGNYNFTDFQAALGMSQLKRIDQRIQKRRDLVQTYRQLLQGMPHVRLFTPTEDSRTAFHLFVVQIDFAACQTTRSLVINQLREKGIGTQVHYIPVYRFPFFKAKSGDLTPYFPQMELYYSQALSLPLYYDLKKENVEFIVHTLKNILQRSNRGTKTPKRVRHKRV